MKKVFMAIAALFVLSGCVVADDPYYYGYGYTPSYAYGYSTPVYVTGSYYASPWGYERPWGGRPWAGARYEHYRAANRAFERGVYRGNNYGNPRCRFK